MPHTKKQGTIVPATSVKSDDVKTIKSRKTGEEVPYVPEEKLLKTKNCSKRLLPYRKE